MAYKSVFNRPISTASQGDYLEDADPSTILRDPRFQREYREMRKRQVDGADAEDWTEEELIEDFYTHQTWVNNNTAAAGVDYGRAAFATDAQKQRMARAQRAYELAPTRGIGSADAWQDWAGALIADPLNAVGVGFGVRGAWQAAKVAGATAGQVIKQGAKRGAVAGAAENALVEGTLDTIIQNRNTEVGLQDEFSFGRLAVATGAGAALGAGLGAGLGGAGAALTQRGMRGTASRLAQAGVPEDVLNNLGTYGQARALERDLTDQFGDSPFISEPSGVPADAVTDPLPGQPAEAADDKFDIGVFVDAKRRAEEQLDEMQRIGAPRTQVRAAERNVAQMTELLQINELIENTRQNTYGMLQSDDAKVRGIANQNLAKVIRLESLARRLQQDPNLAQIEDVTRQRIALAEDLYFEPTAARDMTERDIQPLKAKNDPNYKPAEVGGGAGDASDITAPDPTTGKMPEVKEPETSPAQQALDNSKTAPAKAEAAPQPKTIEDIEADDEAWEIFDIVQEQMGALRGHEQYRATFERVVQSKYGDKAEAVMRLYDEELGNPQGLPKATYEKLAAAEKAEAQPQPTDRAAKRRAAKAGAKPQEPGGSDLPDVSAEVAKRSSMEEQLREMGILGRLVREQQMRRGDDAATASRKGDEVNAAQGRRAEQEAQNRAAVQQGAQRAVKQRRSATARAGDELATGPITTGRNPDGKVQPILRPGQATERDIVTGEATRTVTDGTAPNAREMDREAFELEANAAKEILPWTADGDMTGVIGGTSRAYTTRKGKTKKQTGYVPRGTQVYYSPFTDRYYTDQADALAASGRGPKRQLRTDNLAEWGLVRDEGDAAPVNNVDPAQVADWVRQHLAGEIDTDEFIALVNGAKKQAIRASGDPQAKAVEETISPASTDELTPAIRDRATGRVRVLSQRQEAAGLGVEALYGKSDPANFEVGYVPKGTHSLSEKATKGFRPLDEAELREARDAQDGGIEQLPMSREEAKVTRIELTSVSNDQFDAINQGLSDAGVRRRGRDQDITLDELDGITTFYELKGWKDVANDIDGHTSALSALYELRAKVVPQGIERTVESKAEAADAIEKIFAGHDPKIVAAAKHFIDSLAGSKAPFLRETNALNDFTAWSSGGLSNTVRIGRDPANAPQLFALYHETAHWAYFNILTDADRAEFWRGIQANYFDADGILNPSAVGSRSAPVDSIPNAILSPQEFFANQFTAFVMKGPGATVWQDEGFWNKIWSYMRAIFARFAAKDFIDPSLEPLFAKIIPDPVESARFATISVDRPLTDQGKHILLNINRVNYLHDELQQAIRLGTTETAIAAAEDMAEYLFKLTARGNTFAPLGNLPAKEGGTSKTGKVRMEKAIRDMAYKISEVLQMKPDEGVLDIIDGGSFDDDVLDAADIWLRDAEGTTERTDPSVVFEALSKLFDGGDARSIDTTVSYVSYTLNRAFKRVEGRAFGPQQLPNAYRVKPEYRKNETLKKGLSRRRQRAETEEKAVVEEAIKVAKTPKAARPAGTRKGKAKASGSRDTRALASRDLVRNFRDGDEATRDAAAHEMLRRVKSEPIKEWAKGGIAVPEAVKNARTDELQRMLSDAMAEGDPQRQQQVLYESWRRGENRRRKAAGRAPIMPLIARMVSRAVETEAAHAIGQFDEGIMPGASTVVQEVQSFMSHRDPEVQNTMRTLVYRALNLKGKAISAALDETAILSVGDVYRLAGRDAPPGAAAVFGDFRDPGFNELRSGLRRMAIGLNKEGADPFDVMREVHHLAVRAGILDEADLRLVREQFVEAAQRGEATAKAVTSGKEISSFSEPEIARLAEDWFAENGAIFSMGKVAKGDLFAIRQGRRVENLSARSRLVTLANRAIDATAYLVNGLIGRKTIKQLFRRIDGHGDMFAKNRAAHYTPDTPGVAPEYAAAHYASVRATMSASRTKSMRQFVGNGIGADGLGNPRAFYVTEAEVMGSLQDEVPLDGGDFGYGVYVYAKPQTDGPSEADYVDGAMSRAVEIGEVDGLAADQSDMIERLREVRGEIASLSRRIALPPREGAPFNAARAHEKIAELRAVEGFIKAELEEAGLPSGTRALGVLIRASNPVNLRRNTLVKKTDPIFDAIADTVTARVPWRAYASWHADIPEAGLPGPDFNASLKELLVENGIDPREAATEVGDIFGKSGFDAIHTDIQGRDGIWGEAVVLIDHEDLVKGKRGSPSNNVRSIESTAFDDPSIEFSNVVQDVPAPNSHILGEVLSGREPDPSFIGEIVARLDAAGSPPEFTRHIVGMARNRAPDMGKAWLTTKRFFGAVLSANSDRMERNGLVTPAQWHREHHVDHGVAMGDRVYTLRDTLASLPDTPKSFGRWLDVTKSAFAEPKVPQSHARIVEALRMGDTSPEFAKLNEAERTAATKIKGMLADELNRLRRAGVSVGRVVNYFPQVWNAEKLKAQGEEFIEKLANYFEAESGAAGRRLSRDDAVAKANTVWARITDDDGYHIPPPSGASRSATSDHIDYQRLIRLDDPEFKANYAELKDFLQNDLEGALIKYFDGTSRRILQTERWGAMNHGYYDYLHVIAEGVDGIADLLSTNRVYRRDIKTIAQDGDPFTLELRDETLMPFNGDNIGSKQAARQLLEIFNESGPAAAKQFLMALDPNPAPPKGFTAPDKSTYEHRADAIISALNDGKGKRGFAPISEIAFAQDAMQAAMRKQVGAGPLHTDAARNTSRFIRTFNAVTLLSFTALTSLTDLVLPAIRAGSARNHIKSLAKYATDPVYRRAIRDTGAAIESIVHQRMAGLYAADISGKLGRVNNSFFNATLLTPWTDAMRSIAASTGFHAFKADVERAVGMMVGDGSDMAAQRPEFRQIMRRLNHFGIGDYVYRKQVLSQTDLENDIPLKKAVLKFANESVFAPNPDDMPLWTQTPWGSIIWQLKSYPTMLGRMASDAVGISMEGMTGGGVIGDVQRAWKNKDLSEIDPNNLKRVGYLLTLGPAMGAAVLAAKDKVQFRGGEEGDESEVRNRNWQKWMGYSEEVHGDVNDFAGWYMEGMMALGGFGLLADILHTTAETSDSGAYGQNRVMSALLGPSVGAVGTGVAVVGGVYDKDPESNSNERAAWREAIRRVPFIGGIGKFRNGMVDALAGESDEGNADVDYEEIWPEDVAPDGLPADEGIPQ